MAGLAAEWGINLSMNESNPQWVYQDIIKSRTLARKMLIRKFDTKRFGPKKSLFYIITGEEDTYKNHDIILKQAVDNFIGMIDVVQRRNYYDIKISAFEPAFARDLLTVLIKELDTHQRDSNISKISETRQFIEERIVEIEKELNISTFSTSYSIKHIKSIMNNK